MIINKVVLERIKEAFITLDELAYLYVKACGLDWPVEVGASSIHKLAALDLMINGELTENGGILLSTLFPDIQVVGGYTEDFEKFWRRYPRVTENGRELKKSKKEAFLAYNTAIKKGFSPGDIYRGLEKELAIKTVTSEGLKFMKNIVNYLNTEHFTIYLEDDVNSRNYGEEIL